MVGWRDGFLIGSDGLRRMSRQLMVARRIPIVLFDDLPAIMASALAMVFLLGLACLLCWRVYRGSARRMLMFRRPRGRLFVGPEGHAVFSRLRA